MWITIAALISLLLLTLVGPVPLFRDNIKPSKFGQVKTFLDNLCAKIPQDDHPFAAFQPWSSHGGICFLPQHAVPVPDIIKSY